MTKIRQIGRWVAGSFLFALSLCLLFNSSVVYADGFIDFENGTDQTTIQSTIPGLHFTTTANYDWIYGDWRTNNYNGPYPHGLYYSNGNFFAWLGPNQGYGRIDFTEGCATYLQVYVSSLAGLHMDAYYSNGTVAATASVAGNLNTGQLARLRVDAPAGDCFSYVILHDTGNYWLIDDLSTDAQGVPATRPPVIVLPGIMGSQLDVQDHCTNQTWEVWPAPALLLISPFDDHLNSLKLDEDGYSPTNHCELVAPNRTASNGVENAAIVRLGPDLHVGPLPIEFYAPVINALRQKGFAVYPYGYDWRLDLSRIADASSSDDDLDGFIDQVLASTGAQKVNIVAHSLGGLLARRYVTSDSDHANKVEQIISLGTPYLGAPKTLRVLRWGDTGVPGWVWGAIGTYPPKVREISRNSPSVYQILPTANYFLVNGGGYYSFNGHLKTWLETQSLIRQDHNNGLAQAAVDFHNEAMDNWGNVPLNVAYRLIVGSGKQDTPGVLRERTLFDWRGFQIVTWDMLNTNGDGTVPLVSASLRGNERDFSGNAPTWYAQGLDHLQLVKESYVIDFVGAILATPPGRVQTEFAAPIRSAVYGSWEPAIFNGDKGQFLPRSQNNPTPPVPPQMSLAPFEVNGAQAVIIGNANVHLYDSLGNHTGPIEQGLYETSVPGSDYIRLNDTTFIAFPSAGSMRIEIESLGTQQVDVKVRRMRGVEGNLIQRTVSYAGAPLGSQGNAEMLYDPGNSGTAPSLAIDQNGDGTVDVVMPATGDVGADGSSDATPPQISIQLSGQQTPYGWYVGQVVVAANVADTGTGVATVQYSVDDGEHILPYTASFTVLAEQVQRIVFQATDRAGNRSSVVSKVGAVHVFVSTAMPRSSQPTPVWRQGAGLGGRTVYDVGAGNSACATLFAATDQGVFRSTDRGGAWSRVLLPAAAPDAGAFPFEGAPMTPDGALTPALAVCSANPQVVYAANWGTGVYRSDNGGSTWQLRNSGLNDRYLYDLAVQSNDCNSVYAATNAGGVFKSSNGGLSWQATNHGLGNLATRSLTLAPGAQRLYVGTTNGVFRSSNAAASWEATASLPNGSVWAVTTAPNDASTVYAGLDNAGVYKSTNGGASWQSRSSGLGFSKARTVFADPLDGLALYAGNDQGGGVFRSTDGGASWRDVNSGLGNRNVKSLWQDGGSCHTLHAGTTNGAWAYR